MMSRDEGQDLKSTHTRTPPPPQPKKKNFKANFASSCSLFSCKECKLKKKIAVHWHRVDITVAGKNDYIRGLQLLVFSISTGN